MKIKELLIQGRNILRVAEIENPGFEVEIILAHSLKKDRVFLYTQDQEEMSDKIIEDFFKSVHRREAHEPLAYILGFKEFMGIEFKVNDQVLIPRPDTECMVEFLIDYLKTFFPDGGDVLDLCTGSGAIGIALKLYHPAINLAISDMSKDALKIAEKNAQKLIKSNLKIFHSDLFQKIPTDKKFDLIVSNPPYIPSKIIRNLEPDIFNYEPHLALDGGETGLSFYIQIIKEAAGFMNPGGLLALEIGEDQEASIKALLKESGFKKIQRIKDLAGLSRCVLGFL